jgi:hypothetical protein
MAEEEAQMALSSCAKLSAAACGSSRLYQTGVAHARAVALSTGGWARTDAVEVEPEGQGGALVTWPPPAVVRYMEEGGRVRQLAV